MAVRDSKVFKLGSAAEILRYAGPETIRIDAKGRTIIPGVINVHTHIHDGAMNGWVADNPDTTAVKVFRVRAKPGEIRKNLETLMKERMGNIRLGSGASFICPIHPLAQVGERAMTFCEKRI